MATTNLGRVGMVTKGEYSQTAQYARLDVVTYQNSAYVATAPTTGRAPTDTAYWQPIAYVGDAISAANTATSAANTATTAANTAAAAANTVAGRTTELEYGKQAQYWQIQSGELASFNYAQAGSCELVVHGASNQATVPAPDAPAAITNATGPIAITGCGKNLLPCSATSQTINGINVTVNADKSIKLSGTTTGDGAEIPIYGTAANTMAQAFYLPAGTYTLKSTNISGVTLVLKQVGQTVNLFDTAVPAKCTVTLETGVWIGYAFLWIRSGTTVNATLYPQLETGSVSTADEPYAGATVSAALTDAQGSSYPLRRWDSYDAKTGVLTIGTGVVTLDGTSTIIYELTSNDNSESKLYYFSQSGQRGDNQIVCSYLPTKSIVTTTITDNGVYGNPKGSAMYLRIRFDSGITTLQQLKAALTVTPMIIEYQLATPTTVQCVPIDASALDTRAGINNYLATSGNTTPIALSSDVKYRQDLRLYYDAKIAALTSAVISLGGNV